MTAFELFLEDMKGKRADVIGIGVSNTPLIRLLLKAGAKVTARDKKTKDQLGALAEELAAAGASLILGETYLEGLEGDYIFRTPGLHPAHPLLQQAVKRGSVLTSEMEVFFDVCPCPIIAVTGSDGKTTTATLTYEILKHAGRHCFLGGNIGKPLLAQTPEITHKDCVIVELSSFQLLTMRRSARIAAITNIAPNHLDVHKDMEEYIWAKKNVFAHQVTSSRLVLNRDNEICCGFQPNRGVERMEFSLKGPVERGAYLDDGALYFAIGGKREKIMDASEILLPGKHNIANYLTAAAITYELASFDDIRAVAQSFRGVEHRIAFVREKDGVKYYNDSIASSPTRTIAGLRSFQQKVILIAGGYDKHIPYDELGPEILEHVKYLALTGDTAFKIENAVRAAKGFAQSGIEIERYPSFEKAVRGACGKAVSGDIVLMSPASASFDSFENFAQRGRCFCDIVRSL